MNKVLKKVLIYLGVGALGAVVGVGALIGVSSCAYKQGNTQQKAKAQPRAKQITSDYEQILNNNNIYYFVAKNYSDNGNGVFYNGTMDLAHSAMVNRDYLSLVLEGQYFNADIGEYELTRFYAESELSGGLYRLSAIYYWTSLNSGRYLYYAAPNASDSLFFRDRACFVATQLHYLNDSLQRELYYLYHFFDIYELGSESFTFSKDFNYNAFAQSDQQLLNYLIVRSKSPLVSGSLSVDFTDIRVVRSYYVKPFYVNGYVFDTIKVTYDKATLDLRFFVDSSNTKYMTAHTIDDVNPYYYFSNMQYYNSVSQLGLNVYSRNTVIDSGDTYVLYNGDWLSQDYSEIFFFEELGKSTYVYQVLSMANNGLEMNGFYENINNNDIGLGSVFTLLSQAFMAWTPIFAIQIVPGITIGLLLFLPLIAGVIVLIIWVVKR